MPTFPNWLASGVGSTITGIGAGFSSLKQRIRLPFGQSFVGDARDGTTHHTIGRGDVAGIDGGTLEIVYIGDNRDDCVTFLAPIDAASGNIIDMAFVGNAVALVSPRLVQGYPSDFNDLANAFDDVDPSNIDATARSLDVGIATRSDQGVVTDRLIVNNGETAGNTYVRVKNAYLDVVGDAVISGTVSATNVTPTAWVAVSYQNAWVDYDSTETTFPKVKYRKVGDMVQLRGLSKDGTTSTAAFTLPSGFRPAKVQHFATVSADAFGYFTVTPAGVVTPVVGSGTWFSFNGISFSTSA